MTFGDGSEEVEYGEQSGSEMESEERMEEEIED
jgi:hypothetical protein